MKVCWFCGTESSVSRPSRDQVCTKCRMSLKACKNCRFHDPAAHNQCREPAAEWVRDKELANFCEFFEFADGAGRSAGSEAGGARKAFDDLFKG